MLRTQNSNSEPIMYVLLYCNLYEHAHYFMQTFFCPVHCSCSALAASGLHLTMLCTMPIYVYHVMTIIQFANKSLR